MGSANAPGSTIVESRASVLCATVVLAVCGGRLAAEPASKKASWRFVSIPDFLNCDVRYPEPKWEDALGYVLRQIRAENPDFVLVAGDLVMGRWWDGPKQIEELSKVFYTAWIGRMRDHGLKFYAAVGDHELGDNPWHGKRLEHVPHYERAFVKYLKMPRNGPPGKEGLTYSFVHKNVLFVAVDVFEQESMGAGMGTATFSGKQVDWLRKTLADRADADHVVVMGHTPIIGPVRARASSRLMLKGGRGSRLWQTMKAGGVDLYLCGEVHAITCRQVDGIEHIAHGSLFGYVNTVNYLVATVTPKTMRLELKRIDIVLEGGHLPQSHGNRPREIVRISDEQKKRGFRSVGTLLLDKTGRAKRFRDATGEFANPYTPPRK